MSSTTESIEGNSWDAAVPAPGINTSIITRVMALFSAWQAWREYRRDIAVLAAIDDRLLRDIGLTRSEIRRAVLYGRRGA